MFSLLAFYASAAKEDHTNEDWPEYTGGFSVNYDPSVSLIVSAPCPIIFITNIFLIRMMVLLEASGLMGFLSILRRPGPGAIKEFLPKS